ncbi:MAG: MarC family protein, partial [Rhodospirillaceae bacterium]|nr:MarC family protein [Rhodospirillaceae bacterium]
GAIALASKGYDAAMFELAVSSFVTFFVVIDPPGMVPLFMSVVPGMDAAARRRTAIRGTLAATVILVAAAIAGGFVLEKLGITLAAFRIAGGVLLLLLAIDMVLARMSPLRTTAPVEEAESDSRHDVALVPLAIPLIAGPGAFASVILLMGRADNDPVAMAVVLGVLLGVMLILLGSLLAASKVMDWLGMTGVAVLGRVFGIILAALAIQLIVTGVAESFPALVAVG